MSVPVAELVAVRKRYRRVTALDGIDLSVQRGELLAILGRNGAGKSTTIAVLLGLQKPDSGAVTVFGRSPVELAARRRIGIMLQDVELARVLRVRELLHLTSSYYLDPLPLAEVIERTALGALANQKYGKLSGGQRRLVQFALAICGRPDMLLLDEPTVGLDVQARERLWSIVRDFVREGGAVVLTTHYIEEAEALADRVAVLGGGRVIAAGTVPEIRAHTSQRRLSCVTTLAVEEVVRWPGVVAAHLDRGTLHVSTSEPESIARRLLLADDHVHELEIRRAGLAEAFADITEESSP